MSTGRRSLADFASTSFRGDPLNSMGTVPPLEAGRFDEASDQTNMRQTLYATASREALNLSRSQDNFFKKQTPTNHLSANSIKLKPLMLRKPTFNKHLQGANARLERDEAPQHQSQTQIRPQFFPKQGEVEKEDAQSAKPSRLLLSQLVSGTKRAKESHSVT